MINGHVQFHAAYWRRYVADVKAERQRMLEFLDVPQASLRSPLVKLNLVDLWKVVANLDEVRQCLGNTRFAKYVAPHLGAA